MPIVQDGVDCGLGVTGYEAAVDTLLEPGMARRAPVHGRHEVAAPNRIHRIRGRIPLLRRYLRMEEHPRRRQYRHPRTRHHRGHRRRRLYRRGQRPRTRPRVPGRSRASLGQAAIRADIDQPPRRHLRYPVVSGQAGHQTQDDSFVRRQGASTAASKLSSGSTVTGLCGRAFTPIPASSTAGSGTARSTSLRGRRTCRAPRPVAEKVCGTPARRQSPWGLTAVVT